MPCRRGRRLLVAAALVWLWRSARAFPLKAAALLIGTLLATPYSLDYDLMLLAPAIAFLAADGLRAASRPGRRPCWRRCGSCRWSPARLPQATLIPLAVPVMLLAFALLLRRAMSGKRRRDSMAFCSARLK